MKEVSLDEALAQWASIQNANVRAATYLLIDHYHWLTQRQFVAHCVVIDGSTYWVDWERVTKLLDENRLTGTGSELAVLRFAADLAFDSFGLISVDETSKRLVVDALAHALGVPQ